jgi:hypothetical protein
MPGGKTSRWSNFLNKYAKIRALVPTFAPPRRANELGCCFIKKGRRCYSQLQRFLGRESQKNLGDDVSRRGKRLVRSRAALGLLLLAVTAHAFVAGATHFHRRAVSGAQPSQAALHGDEGGSRGAPLAGDEAQCLLCRLQRSFVSDLQCATLTVAPPSTDTPGYAALRHVSARASCSLLPSGRAPPSA